MSRNRKLKNKKPNYEGRNRRIQGTREENSSAVKSTSNGPEWYAHNSFLLKDTASFPYSWPLGSTAPYVNIGPVPVDTAAIPGVMALHWTPSIGISKDNSSPINTAARNIYSYVRHANSGSSNYDSPDLMLYLMAMDSAYCFYAMLVRAYGLMNLYSYTNRYYPKAVIESMGLDYQDLSEQLADFRAYINLYASKLGSMCVPSSMTYMTRHIWMNSGAYQDGPTSKSQTYLYVQDAYYAYNEYSGAGKLDCLQWYHEMFGSRTLADIVQFGDYLISKVIESEDLNIMSGDILKAYGVDGIFKLAAVPEDYQVIPSYDEEVLSQIMNATLLGYMDNEYVDNIDSNFPYHNTSFDVTQNATSGAILFNPVVFNPAVKEFQNSISGVIDAFSHVYINMYKESPTPEDTMVATRLTNVFSEAVYTAGIQSGFKFDSVGSEICLYGTIWYYNPDHSAAVSGLESRNITMYNVFSTFDDTQILQDILLDRQLLSAFNYHPIVTSLVFDVNAEDTDAALNYVWDFGTYAVLDKLDIGNMHNVALLSEFSVPQMGAFSFKM